MEPAHGASSDNELLERARQGDAEAFGAIYDRYCNVLYGTAMRLVRSPEQAEDVVQEAFMKLHSRPPAPPVRNLGGWLHRVASHAALDRLRRRGRRQEHELIPERAGSRSTEPAAGTDLERALGALPERGRRVFLLHDVEGFLHSEIADMLGISAGTSKSQLFRARRILRQELAGAKS
ncbi:MAG: sigma-70 family RNA polymerase sigma factor [Acidobacteria bacterium]|nr:sigma-70 family RNA polymerase sigma factor [Acidobacteriota bacterium]